MEKQDRVAELKELEDIFTALEEDRRILQNLLQEKNEENEMKLRAMEREMVHERVELESEMRDRGGPAVHFYFRCCLQGQGHERPEDPDGQTGKTGFLCFWAPDIAMRRHF